MIFYGKPHDEQAGLLQQAEEMARAMPWEETLTVSDVPLELEDVHDDLKRYGSKSSLRYSSWVGRTVSSLVCCGPATLGLRCRPKS